MPPPVLAAELPLTVQLVSAVVPLFHTPPPLPPPAELPLTVQPVRFSVPKYQVTPPPEPAEAELPLLVQLVMVVSALLPLKTPPQLTAELPLTVQVLTASVPRLRRAPPRPSSPAVPLGLAARVRAHSWVIWRTCARG